MIEHSDAQPADLPAAGHPTVPVPVPRPGDDAGAARAEIDAAVARLEESRAGDLDAQLAAAENVHEVLSAHLSTGGRS